MKFRRSKNGFRRSKNGFRRSKCRRSSSEEGRGMTMIGWYDGMMDVPLFCARFFAHWRDAVLRERHERERGERFFCFSFQKKTDKSLYNMNKKICLAIMVQILTNGFSLSCLIFYFHIFKTTKSRAGKGAGVSAWRVAKS